MSDEEMRMAAVLAREVDGAIQRATGRRYRIKLDGMDVESLRELIRLLKDLEHDKMMAVRRARREPWRH